MSTVQARAHRSLVWASFVLPVVGVVLLVAGTSAQFAVGDRPLLEEFTPYAFWILGTLLATLGCTLFGAISAIAGGLTHSSAVLLSVGGIVQILAIFATDHARDEWLMLLGAAAFGLGWVVVGLGAWRGERYRPTDEIRRDPPHE